MNMKRVWSIIGALALAFVVGFAVAEWGVSEDSDTSNATAVDSAQQQAAAGFALLVAAQKAWFSPMEEYAGEALSDEKFEALLATLQERLRAEETLADFEREARVYLHSFIRRVAIPELTPEQSENAYAYFEELSGRHPDHQAMIKRQRERLQNIHAQANQYAPPFSSAMRWFPAISTLDTNGETFTGDVVDELIDILDAVLTMPETLADFEKEADSLFWYFGNRLGAGRLTETQTARISAYLNEVEARHPDFSELISRNRYQFENLLPGQTAPNIVGNDLDGVEFKLNEYRGDIVVLYFSGWWCGPCRGEYPYQRFMLELFEDEPVTILSVNSDEEIETIKEAKETEGLHYRVWWDGHGEEPTRGPIATAWNVSAWPTIYILDDQGVIRYGLKSRAQVITAVNELLWEKQLREREEAAESEA